MCSCLSYFCVDIAVVVNQSTVVTDSKSVYRCMAQTAGVRPTGDDNSSTSRIAF